MRMRQPGNLRASLNHYGCIPQMAEEARELTRNKLTVPILARCGRASPRDHCFGCAKAIADSAEGGVIEEWGTGSSKRRRTSSGGRARQLLGEPWLSPPATKQAKGDSMTITKETKSLGMPWEKDYGYVQAVKVGDTIYLAGQVGHDDKGNIVGPGNMEAQMRQAYANIGKVLAQYGATIDNVVDEVLFVTDMDAAYAARVKCRQEVFSGKPALASTVVQIQRLAFPELMIEIKCTAKV